MLFTKTLTCSLSALEINNNQMIHKRRNALRLYTKKKEVESVETDGMWIGIVDEIGDMLEVHQLSLNPGDVMLLYTDGITEATDEKKEMFSDTKLLKVFKEHGHLHPDEIKNGIIKSLQGYHCDDDVTMMVIKRNSVSSPRG